MILHNVRGNIKYLKHTISLSECYNDFSIQKYVCVGESEWEKERESAHICLSPIPLSGIMTEPFHSGWQGFPVQSLTVLKGWSVSLCVWVLVCVFECLSLCVCVCLCVPTYIHINSVVLEQTENSNIWEKSHILNPLLGLHVEMKKSIFLRLLTKFLSPLRFQALKGWK